MSHQLKSWSDYKYRTRRVCKFNGNTGKTTTEYRTPNKKDTDLVFAVYHHAKTPNPSSIYYNLSKSFAKTLDRMSKGNREDGNERRRKITLHSFGDLSKQLYLILVILMFQNIL